MTLLASFLGSFAGSLIALAVIFRWGPSIMRWVDRD
jgi:hypothetical protein